MKGQLANPRRIPHVQGTVDYLRALGAEDVEVFVGRHVRLDWRLRGRAMSMSTSCTPRVGPNALRGNKQVIRRQCRALGIAL